MLSTRRIIPALVAACFVLATLFFLQSPDNIHQPSIRKIHESWRWPTTQEKSPTPNSEMKLYHAKQSQASTATTSDEDNYKSTHLPPVAQPNIQNSKVQGGISYDKSTPPTTGCENIVQDLQRQLIEAYQIELHGIRYANVFGYLETENKGDAAIWAAQQILMSMMGIQFMEACRFLNRDCDTERFKHALESHKPYSAVLMAGGGNFNDFYWEDQPARIAMVANMTDYPIRAFPQSIHMTKPDRIEKTVQNFGTHNNLHLVARDQVSFDWLEATFGDEAVGVEANKIKRKLIPDIAYMWGSRPDFRTKNKKLYNILILARDDWEISSGKSDEVPFGEGKLNLGGSIGEVTYRKVDWKKTKTPGIDEETITRADGTTVKINAETGKNQRAWAKAIEGFRMLGSADFIITDRLHGHIMSTIIGTPHILMDSALKKNLNFHNTWTRDCECTRVADNFEEAKVFARMFFEKQRAT